MLDYKDNSFYTLGYEFLREQAKLLLPTSIYDFYNGSCGEATTSRSNCDSWDDYYICPRVLKGIESVDLSISIMGKKLSNPLFIAPMAHLEMIHSDGELGLIKACNSTKIKPVISMLSSIPLGDLETNKNNLIWAQFYLLKDSKINSMLIEYYESIGIEALVVTVDLPRMGHRPKDIKNDFTSSSNIGFLSVLSEENAQFNFNVSPKDFVNENIKSDITWKDLDVLRSQTKLPIILKGICHHEDVIIAMKMGINCVIISNHGGRQLDGQIPTSIALDRIKQIVGDDIDLLLDGGITNSSHIIKALSLGAKGVLIGRGAVWPLAIGGSFGLESYLSFLIEDLKRAMCISGISSISKMNKKYLFSK